MRAVNNFKDFLLKNGATKNVYFCIKFIYRLFFFYIIPDKVAIKYKFRKMMGYRLDLKNPKNFNEKIQWLKLYDRKKEYSTLVDKYKVRDYLNDILGKDANKYLIPLVFHTKNVKELCVENMPDYPVIIKTNHDQGGIKIIWDKYNVDWNEIQLFFYKRLHNNFFWSNREWPYKNVERRLVVEKLLYKNHELPVDVKLYCFHGVVKLIQLAQADKNGNRKIVFLDTKLNILEKDIYYENVYPILHPIPQDILSHIDEMIEIAEKISIRQRFLRVDFYYFDGKIYIGELTLTPTAGYIKYFSDRLLDELGSYIDLKTT